MTCIPNSSRQYTFSCPVSCRFPRDAATQPTRRRLFGPIFKANQQRKTLHDPPPCLPTSRQNCDDERAISLLDTANYGSLRPAASSSASPFRIELVNKTRFLSRTLICRLPIHDIALWPPSSSAEAEAVLTRHDSWSASTAQHRDPPTQLIPHYIVQDTGRTLLFSCDGDTQQLTLSFCSESTFLHQVTSSRFVFSLTDARTHNHCPFPPLPLHASRCIHPLPSLAKNWVWLTAFLASHPLHAYLQTAVAHFFISSAGWLTFQFVS